MSIRQKVFFSTLSLVIVAVVLTSAVYLLFFSRVSRNLIEVQSKEINKQIVLNYERYISSVIEIADYLQLAVSTMDVEERADDLDDAFLVNNEITDDVVSIFLFDRQGRRLVGDRIRPIPDAPVSGARWFVAARDRPEIYHFFVGRSSNIEVDRNENVITVARHVSYLRDGRQRPGVLLMELNTQAIIALAERTNLGAAGHILIIDERDELVYASATGVYAEASFDIAARTYLGGSAERVHDLDMYVHANTLIHTRWRIVTVSNIDPVNAAIRQVLYLILVIGAISVALTALVAGLISVRISRPVDQLKDIMARIEAGDFHTTIAVRGQKEIVKLSRSFNQMVMKVRELMDRLVAEQRDKRKTELRALQNQINPHFLYNTLDSIVWLAEHQRTEDVVTTVVALAKFFRIGISKGETFISVRQEVEHIENYLTIQKIRYVEKFEYTLDIAEEIADRLVMKLILQPIVENAIYHGMGDEKGWISIDGRPEGDHVVFEVRNGGYGLTEAQISHIRSAMTGSNNGAGVGLRNVYQRLKLYYGEDADVEIESVADESTCVRLIIPANRSSVTGRSA